MAMSASRLQFLLAQSPIFQGRVQMLLCSVASGTLSEPLATAQHAARANYAKLVLANPSGTAAFAAVFLAQSTNVAGTITMEDEGVRTSVTDAELLAGIAFDWNKLASVDTSS